MAVTDIPRISDGYYPAPIGWPDQPHRSPHWKQRLRPASAPKDGCECDICRWCRHDTKWDRELERLTT